MFEKSNWTSSLRELRALAGRLIIKGFISLYINIAFNSGLN